MMGLFLVAALVLLAFMGLLLYRIVVGPTVIDRLLAVNVIGTKSIVILIIMGILFDRVAMFIDIALAYGLLNFIASLAAAKYFRKHKKIHHVSTMPAEVSHDH
jgi:multicomponent Na+:H+ antiporter subunit F